MTTEIDWLEKHKDHNDSTVYLLSEMQNKCQVLELCDDGYLTLMKDKDPESTKLTFGVFSFCYSDESGVYLTCQFHGYGFTGLGECRHTYWGEDGYIFYPNGKLIGLAFKELSKYFDELD